MKIVEEQRDLFEVNAKVTGQPYCLAHCISADFGMFGGIVVGFNERWNMKNELLLANGDRTEYFRLSGAFILPVNVIDHEHKTTIFNLVTKQTVADKPTYDDLNTALKYMKGTMNVCGYTKLAIPTIGCGIDGLDWDIVKSMIAEVFEDTDIEILVCKR